MELPAPTYASFMYPHPPRRGNGPWWTILAVNILTKSKSKTHVWMHSNPALLISILNRADRGTALWVPAMEIGPFTSERAADGFARTWETVASKERESRVLWGHLLFDAYHEAYGLHMTICNPKTLVISDTNRKFLARQKVIAGKLKRARRGDPLSTRQRMWELLPERERRLTCGDARVRRDAHAKRKPHRRR